MDARSGPLANPLAQFALGAVALVVGAALLFALIGAVTGDATPGGGPPVAGDGNGTDPGTTPSPGPTSPTGTTEPETAPTGGATETPTDPPTETPTAAETDTSSAIDPSRVTVQVLDGVLDDGGAKHAAVVACLREAGYGSLITGHRSSRVYDATTVFFTAGGDNEAAARQVASVIGVGSVGEKPSNLSGTVPVHIVVGRDATSPC